MLRVPGSALGPDSWVSTFLRAVVAKLVEISLAVGYESEAAFSRAFKREVGVSPGTWRRRAAPVAVSG